MILSALLYVCIVNADGNKECDVRGSRIVEMFSKKDCEDWLNFYVVEISKDTLRNEPGSVVAKTYVKCMQGSEYNASLREVPVTLESLGYSTVMFSFF